MGGANCAANFTNCVRLPRCPDYTLDFYNLDPLDAVFIDECRDVLTVQPDASTYLTNGLEFAYVCTEVSARILT